MPVARHAASPGQPSEFGNGGPLFSWLVRHESGVAAEMRWALQPKDWLRLQPTGEIHTEPSGDG